MQRRGKAGLLEEISLQFARFERPVRLTWVGVGGLHAQTRGPGWDCRVG